MSGFDSFSECLIVERNASDRGAVDLSKLACDYWFRHNTLRTIPFPSPQPTNNRHHHESSLPNLHLRVPPGLPEILTYSYPWPIVTLAWFLRYPNPYAQHVLSTDTIHQSLNPQTHVLTVVRLHLKKGRLPVWSRRVLAHISESWVVETTEVDLRNRRMETRMRNLDHKKVLYVEERGTWTADGERYAPVHGRVGRGGLWTVG